MISYKLGKTGVLQMFWIVKLEQLSILGTIEKTKELKTSPCQLFEIIIYFDEVWCKELKALTKMDKNFEVCDNEKLTPDNEKITPNDTRI
jgi:hypothetical protein